jgi:4-hydroxyphenylacetate 3-monooxygenase
MIKDGSRYLAGFRDGRLVLLRGERVEDVTTPPGFRNAARSYAALHDARLAEMQAKGHS